MRVLVLGGIRSGKSQWAESVAQQLAGEGDRAPVRYVATGPVPEGDADWATRVEAHQVRRPAHWQTVETTDLTATLTAAPPRRDAGRRHRRVADGHDGPP